MGEARSQLLARRMERSNQWIGLTAVTASGYGLIDPADYQGVVEGLLQRERDSEAEPLGVT